MIKHASPLESGIEYPSTGTTERLQPQVETTTSGVSITTSRLKLQLIYKQKPKRSFNQTSSGRLALGIVLGACLMLLVTSQADFNLGVCILIGLLSLFVIALRRGV